MKSIYIAGPITGMPNLNIEAFTAIEDTLVDLGWEDVVNPHRIGAVVREDRGHNACGQDYMDYCISDLCKVSAICLLPGWQDSTGAALEAAIAKCYNLDFYKAEQSELGGRHWTVTSMEVPKEIIISKSYPRR